MELTDDIVEELRTKLGLTAPEVQDVEPGPIELDASGEHFVEKVVIDGEHVTVVCSCSQSFGPHEVESDGRLEYNEHYESVMR